MVRGPSEEALCVGPEPVVPSKIVVAVRFHNGGTKKVHMVHDLSRSGVSHRVHLQERSVLPRLSDVMGQVIRLLRSSPESPGVKFMVLDFSDAFKQPRVAKEEQCFLVGRW